MALWLARTLRSALGVDLEVDGVADRNLAGRILRLMGVEAAERLRRILNIGVQALVAADLSGVADLPAAFAVERRLVGQDDDLVAGAGALDARAVLDQGDDRRPRLHGRHSR